MNIGLADKNNRLATIILAALAGLAGSIVTIITAVSMVWAILSVLAGRFRLSLDRPTVILSLAALFYVLAALASTLVNLPGSSVPAAKAFAKLGSLVLFLSPLFLVSRLRLSRPQDLLSAFALGAALCGLLVLPLAAYQMFALGTRAEGGAGNAIPFAMLCALFSTLSLLNAEYPQPWRKVLGWAGFAAGTFSLFLSQTKGVAVMPLIGVVLYLAMFRLRATGVARVVALLLLICAVMVAAFYASGAINRVQDISVVLAGDVPENGDSSYGPRVILWKAGLQIFAEHPVFGNGPQHIPGLIKTMGTEYTHFHNGFITKMVGGGLVGLLALVCLLLTPLALCLRARGDANGAPRLYIASMLVLTYVIGGMTNFIFGHDIYDSVFLFTASLCIASIAQPDPEP